MDLAKQIKTDPGRSSEGVWFDFMEDAEFRIRSQGTPEYRVISAEVTERYRPQLRIGGAVAVEARVKIKCEIAARYLLADWKNVSDEGVKLECTEENRIAICDKYLAVTMFAEGCSLEISAYRLADDGDEPKN